MPTVTNLPTIKPACTRKKTYQYHSNVLSVANRFQSIATLFAYRVTMTESTLPGSLTVVYLVEYQATELQRAQIGRLWNRVNKWKQDNLNR